MSKKDLTPPKSKRKGDYAHALAKAGISAIPAIGGPASELFAAVVMPPLEKRRIAWMETIGEELKRLQDEGIDLKSLQENDEFIDIVMSASTVAIKTAQEEKRIALRNAVINVASGHSPDEALAQVFISLIDKFTGWHLKVLKLFQDPREWARIHDHDFGSLMTSHLSKTLTSAYPELEDRRSFYDQIWSDLRQSGLVNTESLAGMMTAEGALEKRTTNLGDSYLAFIESE